MALTLQDLLPYISSGLDYLQRRSATNNAQDQLVAGGDAAMKTITDASGRVSGINSGIYGEQKELLAPWMSTGNTGRLKLEDFLANDLNDEFTVEDFENTPGYQFERDEMIKALDTKAAREGLLNSGGAYRTLVDRVGDLSSTRFTEARNAFNADRLNKFNIINNTSNMGLDAAGAAVNAGSNYGGRETVNQAATASSIADIQQAIANAKAMGDMARASELTDLLGQVTAQEQDRGILNSVLDTVFPEGSDVVDQVSKWFGSSKPAIDPQTLKDAAASVPWGVAAPAAAGAGVAGAGGLSGIGFGSAATTAGLGTAGSEFVAGGLPALLGAPNAGIAAPIAPTAAGGGGLSGALSAVAPWLVPGAVAAVAIPLIWQSTQAHQYADIITPYQSEFDKAMDGLWQSRNSGQIDDASYQQMTHEAVKNWLTIVTAMSSNGGRGETVAGQAMDTFRQSYGDPRDYGVDTETLWQDVKRLFEEQQAKNEAAYSTVGMRNPYISARGGEGYTADDLRSQGA